MYIVCMPILCTMQYAVYTVQCPVLIRRFHIFLLCFTYTRAYYRYNLYISHRTHSYLLNSCTRVTPITHYTYTSVTHITRDSYTCVTHHV